MIKISQKTKLLFKSGRLDLLASWFILLIGICGSYYSIYDLSSDFEKKWYNNVTIIKVKQTRKPRAVLVTDSLGMNYRIIVNHCKIKKLLRVGEVASFQGFYRPKTLLRWRTMIDVFKVKINNVVYRSYIKSPDKDFIKKLYTNLISSILIVSLACLYIIFFRKKRSTTNTKIKNPTKHSKKRRRKSKKKK